MPSWRLGSYWLDLRGDTYSEANYLDLLRTLHKARKVAPDVGPTPDFRLWGGPKPSPPPGLPDPLPAEAWLPLAWEASELPPAIHAVGAVPGETAARDMGRPPGEVTSVAGIIEHPDETARPPKREGREPRRRWWLTRRRAAVAAVLFAVITSGYLVFDSHHGQIILNRLYLTLKPGSVETWKSLSWDYAMIGRLKDAEHCLDEAVRLEPEDGKLRNSRATFLMDLANARIPRLEGAEKIRLGKKAIADFDRALALGFDFIHNHVDKAELLIKTGHPELAIPELTRVVGWVEGIVSRTQREPEWYRGGRCYKSLRGMSYWLRGVAYLRKGEDKEGGRGFFECIPISMLGGSLGVF